MKGWKRSSFKSYWYALECLPPASMTAAGFLLGEPQDHFSTTGEPRFWGYVQTGSERATPRTDKYYKSTVPMTVGEFAKINRTDFAPAAKKESA